MFVHRKNRRSFYILCDIFAFSIQSTQKKKQKKNIAINFLVEKRLPIMTMLKTDCFLGL